MTRDSHLLNSMQLWLKCYNAYKTFQGLPVVSWTQSKNLQEIYFSCDLSNSVSLNLMVKTWWIGYLKHNNSLIIMLHLIKIDWLLLVFTLNMRLFLGIKWLKNGTVHVIASFYSSLRNRFWSVSIWLSTCYTF